MLIGEFARSLNRSVEQGELTADEVQKIAKVERRHSMPSPDEILQALAHVQEPELHGDLVSLNMIRDLKVSGGRVEFTVMTMLG